MADTDGPLVDPTSLTRWGSLPSSHGSSMNEGDSVNEDASDSKAATQGEHSGVDAVSPSNKAILDSEAEGDGDSSDYDEAAMAPASTTPVARTTSADDVRAATRVAAQSAARSRTKAMLHDLGFDSSDSSDGDVGGGG